MRLRRLASHLYARGVAPFGSRALDRMLADGLPRRFETPLRFLFDDDPSPRTRELSDRIELLRDELAARTTPWLANVASVQQRWGVFLHLCAEAFDAHMILELGACLGISGAYLASARSAPRLVTLDGSAERVALAAQTIEQVAAKPVVIEGQFSDTLQHALAQCTAPIDVAFIDGHHDPVATQQYVAAIRPQLANTALIILDDIRHYDGMFEAWRTLRSLPGVAASIDVGRFGLLMFGDGDGRFYDLSRYTGWWRVNKQRPVVPAASRA